MKHTTFFGKPALSTVKNLTLFVLLALSSCYAIGYKIPFLDPISLLIVLGGTITVGLLSYDYQILMETVEEAYNYENSSSNNLYRRFEILSTIAKISKKKGPLALEDVSRKMNDPLLQKTLQLIADGASKTQVLHIAKLEARLATEQIQERANMLHSLSTVAPALGLIGTIIGLIQMLGNISDQNMLGAGMSIALLTTLYGAILSYLVLQPLALKLESKAKELSAINELSVEGVDAIYDGLNAELLRERLSSFMA